MNKLLTIKIGSCYACDNYENNSDDVKHRCVKIINNEGRFKVIPSPMEIPDWCPLSCVEIKNENESED